MAESRRRSSFAAGLARLCALGAAGAAAWFGAGLIADEIETRSEVAARRVLLDGGYDWAVPRSDGLRVILRGTAPDEVSRFRLLSAMGQALGPVGVVDQLRVAPREMFTPPDYELEILRNDDGLSLIGLVPSRTDRAGLTRLLREATGAAQVTDLMSAAAYPPPEGWQPALEYGLRAAAFAPRATISVAPGRVSVRAVADDPEGKDRLEADLRRIAPETIALETDITAPLPVISPFALRFVRAEGAAGLENCAAGSEAERDAILAAAQAAGAGENAGCQLGIGAPSPEWGEVAAKAIAAVGAMGAGTLSISDRAISLIAPAEVDPDLYARETERLEADLPAPFTLSTEREQAIAAPAGPPLFVAMLDHHGHAEIAGRVGSAEMVGVIENLARARLGPIEGGVELDPTMPQGWSVRVIAGLEAMTPLDEGEMEISEGRIAIDGVSGDAFAADRAIAAIARRLGEGVEYALRIGYDKYLDPTLELASGPECVDQLNVVMAETGIGFGPAGAVIEGDTEALFDALGDIMAGCTDYRIEVAGHTDAQGRDETNLALSRDRAEAVIERMDAAGIDTRHLSAEGYGAARPIESNDTPEGREANRRIEFELLSPEPVADQIALRGILRTGATPAPEDAPVPPDPVPAPAEDPEDAAPRPDWAEPEMTEAEIDEIIAQMEALVIHTPDDTTPRPRLRPDDLAGNGADGAAAPNEEADE